MGIRDRRSRSSRMARFGLLGVLSAKQIGGRTNHCDEPYKSRQKLAREFGATDIVVERGEDLVRLSPAPFHCPVEVDGQRNSHAFAIGAKRPIASPSASALANSGGPVSGSC
jgi:hypothetical protein